MRPVGQDTKPLNWIKKMINLEHIDLSSNEIENIEYLKNMKKLKVLNLNGNKITDISPLAEL